MLSSDYMKKQVLYLEGRVCELSDKLKEYPEGDLRCYPSGGSFSNWIVYKNKPRRYIYKRELDIARKMADKKALEAELSDCRAQLAACRRYLKSLEAHPANAQERLFEDAGINRFLKRQGKDEVIRDWLAEPYKKNPKYPEHLTVPTITGEKMRSKSEAMCAQILYSMEIPFRYEQLHFFDGSEFYPDFTVLRPRDQGICLIEIFGMMDDGNYAASAYRKLRIYAENGYIPDQNLLCFFESGKYPLDMMFVKMTLEYFFCRG